jgi:predicted nucleic acid-binding protein
MIVADTTLISYFTIEGEFTEDAVAVRREDPQWAAPLLWRAEFLNAPWSYVNQDVLELSLALEHLDTAEDLIGKHSYDVSAPHVLRLAADSGCTAYDCHYVALARMKSVPLVTHDTELQAVFPGRMVSPDAFLR